MGRLRILIHSFFAFIIVALVTSQTNAQTQLPADLIEKIDKVATDTLTRTGVPSASIAVVKDGQVVYVKAYGDARLEPKTPATAEMRYSIGSISKQFTAAAILLLQEQGKLLLDDKVGKFIPDLTRANEVLHSDRFGQIRLQCVIHVSTGQLLEHGARGVEIPVVIEEVRTRLL